LIGSAALGVLALQALPAAAEDEGRADRYELSFYAAQQLGDDLDGIDVAGQKPKLDDHVAYGIRYGQRFTDSWSLELSIGHSATDVTRLNGPDIDLDLTTFDADAVWHFAHSSRWDPYVAFGVGYAWADLDQPIAGLVDGRQATIDDDNSYTLNAGIGAKYFATKRMTLQLEARYRYYNRLLDPVDHSTGTFEPTVAVGWRF